MAKASKNANNDGRRLIASNRKARRNYDILETVEAGIVLRGSEVKSLREATVQIAESFAQISGGEVWVHGMHVPPYANAQSHSGHDPDRRRKLLLHAGEIEHLRSRVDEQRLTLVPLSLYFREGKAKVELALARGRKDYDKRQVMAERDAQREADRAMAAARRR